MIDHSKPPDSAAIAPVTDLDSLVRAESGIKNCSERELRCYRRLYQIYPQIRETVYPELGLPLAAEKMTEDYNPPVGVLLFTEKNRVLVEYALACLDNRLFVSKYQLSLPDKEEMRRFIEEQMEKELGSAVGSTGGDATWQRN